jgi:hypothetical protein
MWLNRRMRWVMGAQCTGGGLFVGGILGGAVLGQAPLLTVALPGFAVACVFTIAAHLIAFPCPRCHGNLAPLVMGWFSVDKRLRFCPYCGGGLDDELPAKAATGADQ